MLIKPLLLQHKKKQKDNFKKLGKKWSEKEYVFLNSTGTPFIPKVLSRNFTKFLTRNSLPHIILYGLRHSFATHCRNLGMEAEVLALLMGHIEYETTQKYYIHISSKQKKDQLQKVQNQNLQIYLSNENKDLTHLQNNVTKYNKNVSNLHQVQDEDMLQYLQLNDDTLSILRNFMLTVNEKIKLLHKKSSTFSILTSHNLWGIIGELGRNPNFLIQKFYNKIVIFLFSDIKKSQ